MMLMYFISIIVIIIIMENSVTVDFSGWLLWPNLMDIPKRVSGLCKRTRCRKGLPLLQ